MRVYPSTALQPAIPTRLHSYSGPGLASIICRSVPDAAERGNLARRNGLLSGVLEFVHLLLGSIVLLEDEPENNGGEEGRNAETS